MLRDVSVPSILMLNGFSNAGAVGEAAGCMYKSKERHPFGVLSTHSPPSARVVWLLAGLRESQVRI